MFFLLVPEKLQTALTVFLDSLIRSTVCHCHWPGPKWPCFGSGSPRGMD